MLEVPCATAGTGTTGVMFGRLFICDIEADFAWFEVGVEVPAATTGVDNGFFTAPAAEAYDVAAGAAALLGAAVAGCWVPEEVISNSGVGVE